MESNLKKTTTPLVQREKDKNTQTKIVVTIWKWVKLKCQGILEIYSGYIRDIHN